MAINPLSSNLSSSSQAYGVQKSSSKLAASIAALSSGKRITQAFQDIASLSVGTSLQSQVTGLRQASLNVSQASSMLQVADGAAGQIGDILQRMQSISVQANSGALSASSREGLNREYQQLGQEINRLSGNTSFNNVKLLDGSLSGGNGLTTDTSTATKATGSLQFSANVGAGKTIVLNGVTLTEGVDFNAGASIGATLDNLVTALNNSSNAALSGATYQRTNNTLQITADTAGAAGNQFTINQGASTAAASFNTVGNLVSGPGNIFTLQGGGGSGVGGNSVTASGVSGDNLVAGQTATAASTSLQFTSAANIVAGNSINIDDGNGGLINFTFVNGAPANNTQIQIGSSLEETLGNAASTINNYSGNNDFVVRQLDARVNGNSIDITGKANGNVNDAVGAAANVTLTTAGGFITNTTLNNGSTGGVNTSGVSNAAFVGQIQGFTATQTGTNSVQASIKVGNETYTANIANTNSAANTTVRFTSANGGSFDVDLAGNNGQAVNNQGDANSFAKRLDAAFSGLSFSQQRNVSDFNGAGNLGGATLSITSDNFTGTQRIDSVKVNAATNGSSNATFEVTINGETFRSSSLGKSIGAGETVTLTSLNNANRTLDYTNGSNKIDLSTQSSADQFRRDFEDAAGTVAGGGGAAFQISNNADQQVKLNIGDLSLNGLFPNGLGDLLSQNGAALASGAIGNALNNLISTRADIGAFQSNLNFAAANIDSAIANQDAARSVLLDTDFATESSNLATASVQQKAGIALQAQTNRLIPSMLDLLKGS